MPLPSYMYLMTLPHFFTVRNHNVKSFIKDKFYRSPSISSILYVCEYLQVMRLCHQWELLLELFPDVTSMTQQQYVALMAVMIWDPWNIHRSVTCMTVCCQQLPIVLHILTASWHCFRGFPSNNQICLQCLMCGLMCVVISMYVSACRWTHKPSLLAWFRGCQWAR